ncbi:rRNA maturation RNase YbeY [Derxia lacustris]|uniref:rRNA maturation RNase YbeY n=1 Tax=Derxia lacustris TaxID=764842 RepID=UPI000A1709F8|nr:rRNA maturation RNase YbeY [Derxia lacustris]
MPDAAAPTLHLAVQYAPPLRVEELPARDRIRRWARSALLAGLADAGQPRDASFTVRFTGAREGRALNRDHRGRDYATNVLTFNLHDIEDNAAPIEADIVVCVPVVAREASAQRKTFEHHCAHMIVHAVLHACGYEHEADAEADAMEALETRILKRFRIADPYLPQEPLLPARKPAKKKPAPAADTAAPAARRAKKKAAEAA